MEAITIILLLGILAAVYGTRTAGVSTDIAELAHRLRRLERQFEAVAQHLGVELPREETEGSVEVRRLLQAGDFLQAIKVHRKETGLGLADAKAAVERVQASLAVAKADRAAIPT